MFMTRQKWLGQVLKTKILASLDSWFFKTFFSSFTGRIWPYNICDIGLYNLQCIILENGENILWKSHSVNIEYYTSFKKLPWRDSCMKELQVISLIKLNSLQVFFNFLDKNICFQGAPQMLILNKRKYNCNKKMIIYDKSMSFLIRNV